MIDEHYYVFFYVDRSCINIYNTSERNIHEFFVYGYDDERKILYCADNLSTGKYTLFESDIESVVRGYQNVSGYNYFTDIVGISNEVSDEWFEEIKFNQLIGLYRDYAESRLTSNFGERFNVSECGFILQEKEIIKLSNNINRARDIRDFCIFRDHKKLMSYRFDILSKRYNGINFDNVCRS